MKRIIFLLLLLPCLLSAQNKLTIEKLWQLGRVSDPQVSPDGKILIYGVRTFDVKSNRSTNLIYSMPAAGGEPRAISEVKINAFSARWRPDGAKITYLSAVTGEVQVWEMNPDGTSKSQVTKIAGGVNGYKYSPALNAIAYVADVKLDKEVKEIYPDLDKTNARIIDGLMYRHWDAWHDYAYSHLFYMNYADGKATGEAIDVMKDERNDCPLPPHGDDDEFNFSPDGKKLVYNSKKFSGTEAAISTNSDIYLYDLKSKETVNLSYKNLGYDKGAQFSPDGTKIAWLQMKRAGNESDRNTLVMYDFNFAKSIKQGDKMMTVEPIKSLTANFDYTLENFLWLDNSRLCFTAVFEATKQIYLFDPKLKSTTQIVPLTQGAHDYGSFSIGYNNKKPVLVGAKMSISMPTELFLIDMNGKPEKPITFSNKPILDNLKMGKVEKRMVKTTDGKDMLVWVILPPDFDATKKYPTLLYCQGGPQSPVSQFFSYRWNFQLMAANGYIVVAPNRRGLPGFGSEWNDAISQDYGGQCMKDYMSAIDDVSKEPFVNKDKLGAVGASFGGFSVYWLAGNHNKRFKTFIAHCGMFNMESWYGSTEEMFFANNDNGGPYWSQTAHPNNFDSSPHKFVQNWDAPILVIHNEKDFRVPITQGMEAFTAAQIKGVPSRFLYFPDENHWVVKPQNSVLWQRVYYEWLDKWLK